MSDIKLEGFQNPYPAGAELEYLEILYDELINVTKEVFNLSDFVAIDNRREDTLIEFESVKNSKISIGVDDVKDKNTETTTFIKDDKKVDVVKTEVTTESNELQEAIKTFEELIGFGGTDDEIKEWNEAIETFKMLI